MTLSHILGIAGFVGSSYMQFKSHAILASLRKDSKGKLIRFSDSLHDQVVALLPLTGNVVTYQHSIPRGDWFEVISCPHYFAEILIYLSLSVVLGGRSTTWWMVCCFVVTNQLIVGLFNHQWYIDTFKNYPKSRKAVIPLLL